MTAVRLTCLLRSTASKITPLFRRNAGTVGSFKYSDLELNFKQPEECHTKPDVDLLVSGEKFTDHMLRVPWDLDNGWGTPSITPLKDLELHPAAKVFHYAIEVSEGIRAYRGVDEHIRLFRPDKYIQRLLDSTNIIALPRFDGNEFLQCLTKLIEVEKEWVPSPFTSSLFAQTTIIGTEPTVGVRYSTEALLYTILSPAGPSFHNGFRPISVLADKHNIRSWFGGFGNTKLGATYAPTVQILKEARDKGFEQVLWLYGENGLCTQLGDMNIFVDLVDRNGVRQLLTPPLNDLILPGVTRLSLLELVRQWGQWNVVESTISIGQLLEAHLENRLLGFFAVGNGGLLTPVSDITYDGHTYHIKTMYNSLDLIEKFIQTMADILHGKIDHPWAVKID